MKVGEHSPHKSPPHIGHARHSTMRSMWGAGWLPPPLRSMKVGGTFPPQRNPRTLATTHRTTPLNEGGGNIPPTTHWHERTGGVSVSLNEGGGNIPPTTAPPHDRQHPMLLPRSMKVGGTFPPQRVAHGPPRVVRHRRSMKVGGTFPPQPGCRNGVGEKIPVRSMKVGGTFPPQLGSHQATRG